MPSYWDMLAAYAPQDPNTVPLWPPGPPADLSWATQTADPNEIAAQRMRQSVRPQTGRQEGAATNFLSNAIPGAARAVDQFGNNLALQSQAMRQGDYAASYDPAPGAELMATMFGIGGPYAMMRGGASAGAAGGRMITPEGLAVAGKDYTKASREVLDEIAAGPKGAGPLDLSTAGQVPGVPQVPLDRLEPPRGVSQRMQDALQSKAVTGGVSKSIDKGIEIGADKWYHTEPVRLPWIEELGKVEGPRQFANYMDMVAATSPRSDVPTNIRNASYYYQHAKAGKELPDKLPYPYGHVAQNLHRQNFETLAAPRPGALSADAPVSTGWDIYKNPKPASFSQNLQGNLAPGTMDTHAFRNIAMRTGDPRFLATSLQQIYKPGVDRAADSLVQRYGEVKGDKVVFRPQSLHESGDLTLKDAKKIPSFWASMPNPNEYAAAEQLYRRLGVNKGLPTADAQAAGWAGAGELTGLGTVPTHTFPELFNERVLYTAKMRGEKPQDTLRWLISGKKPLLGLGGAAAGGVLGLDQQQ